MKIEEKQILPKDQIISRLREIADALEAGSFSLGGQDIRLPDAAELELEFKAKKGKEELEIEIEWMAEQKTEEPGDDAAASSAAASSDGKVRTLE